VIKIWGDKGNLNEREGGFKVRDRYAYHNVTANVLLTMYNTLLVNQDEDTFKLLAKLLFLRADRLLANTNKYKGKIIIFKDGKILKGDEKYKEYDLEMLKSYSIDEIWVAMTEKQKEAGLVEVEIFKTTSLLSKLQERGEMD